MKKRVIWKMLVLSIVTLGIYRLYWFVKTRREMMSKDPTIKIMSVWLLVLPVILLIVGIGTFTVSTIISGTNQSDYCRTLNDDTSNNSITSSNNELPLSTTPKDCYTGPPLWAMGIFYVAILLFGPLIAWWMWGYSKGVEKITHEKTNFAIAMIVLLMVPDGIDILIIQDAFNKQTPPPANTTTLAPDLSAA